MISTSRHLYDNAFVNAGCPPQDYDETTELDTTTGTYITNYVIGAVGLLSALVFLKRAKSPNWIPAYFIISGIGYAVAGVGHQVVDNTDDSKGGIFTRLSHILVSLGLLALQYAHVTRRMYRILLILLLVLVLVLTELLRNQVVVGFYVFLVLLLFAIYYGYWRCDVFPCLGCLSNMSGLLVQIFLSGKCGDAGYYDCWQACPLPNPMTFNHNSLFHVLVAVGLLLQALGLYDDDKLSHEQEKENEDSFEGNRESTDKVTDV
jgi:hypothetical protein